MVRNERCIQPNKKEKRKKKKGHVVIWLISVTFDCLLRRRKKLSYIHDHSDDDDDDDDYFAQKKKDSNWTGTLFVLLLCLGFLHYYYYYFFFLFLPFLTAIAAALVFCNIHVMMSDGFVRTKRKQKKKEKKENGDKMALSCPVLSEIGQSCHAAGEAKERERRGLGYIYLLFSFLLACNTIIIDRHR